MSVGSNYYKMIMPNTIEYELVGFEFESSIGEDFADTVCEDEVSSYGSNPHIERDANGIPMGGTYEEVCERRNIIREHIQKWRREHAENPRVFNENLNEHIKVTQVFLLESVSHAAIKYQSTKAVLRMGEIIEKATKVGVTNRKEGNSNQKPFEKMIVMRYQSEELGVVKMTVGVRNRTHEKVEYSITVPSPGEPFIADALKKKQKKKKRS